MASWEAVASRDRGRAAIFDVTDDTAQTDEFREPLLQGWRATLFC